MSVAYQYNAHGYFAGECEDFGLLPNNATHTVPDMQEGFIPKWNGEAWEQVENHIGKQGYVNGEPFTVKSYGALPDGWSDESPEPTEEEKYHQEKGSIDANYSAEKTGVLTVLKESILVLLCNPVQDSTKLESLRSEYQKELKNRQDELDALDAKYNVA